MGLHDIKDFSAEEVGLWLVAQGLGDHAKKFLDEGVDGDLLLSLSVDDFKNDLGLSGLQAKKVMKNVEFSKELTASAGGGGGEDVEKLKGELAATSADKEDLRAKVEALVGEKATLEEKIKALEEDLKAKDGDIADLNKKMESMTVVEEKAAPAPAPPPAPAPAPARHVSSNIVDEKEGTNISIC